MCLTFAARATASFPAAFPPAQLGDVDRVLERRGCKLVAKAVRGGDPRPILPHITSDTVWLCTCETAVLALDGAAGFLVVRRGWCRRTDRLVSCAYEESQLPLRTVCPCRPCCCRVLSQPSAVSGRRRKVHNGGRGGGAAVPPQQGGRGRTGQAGRRVAAVPWRSYKFMSDEELQAVWVYLQSLPKKAYGNR